MVNDILANRVLNVCFQIEKRQSEHIFQKNKNQTTLAVYWEMLL